MPYRTAGGALLVPMTGGVDRAAQGRQIAARRMALGIDSHAEFSRRTGIARATLAAAENGTASANTYARLDVWLAQQEGDGPHEVDLPSVMASDSDVPITFEITGPATEWQVKVSGPPAQADELRRQAVELLREWHSEKTS